MIICKCCDKKFKTERAFQAHATEVTKDMSDRELIEAVYKSGGCSKEYYDKEIARLNELEPKGQ